MAPSRDSPKLNGSAADGPTPDVASRLHVERNSGAFTSGAISKIDLPAGVLFARITTATPAKKAYSSVQTGENSHIELNSDLVFCNHSCHPSLIFDMAKFEIRVHEGRDLKEGDALTFFYPSSEWDMAQPFECTCGAKECLGTIRGAGDMDETVLRGFWLNEHIERMLDAKDVAVSKKNGVVNGTNGEKH